MSPSHTVRDESTFPQVGEDEAGLGGFGVGVANAGSRPIGEDGLGAEEEEEEDGSPEKSPKRKRDQGVPDKNEVRVVSSSDVMITLPTLPPRLLLFGI